MGNELAYHDVYTIAYADLKGIPIKMIKEDRRVIFLLPDEPKTYQVLGEFNSNPSLPLLNYITHLKKIRAQMIVLQRA
jgi:hypothetical protein